MRKVLRAAILMAVMFGFAQTAYPKQRFPIPEFETGYKLPEIQKPAPRSRLMQHLDVLILAAVLVLASWLALKTRRRRDIYLLSLFSLFYFGFYRLGCVCAIGSIQNVALGLADSSYAVSLSVMAFFVLPLATALFFGRSFCAAACPHGALQDVLCAKPLKVPRWLEHGLRIIPYFYLGSAILLAATGSAFIICEYDPFIAIFRLTGNRGMVIFGIAMLVTAIFIGRPYCRFLCPYGALLGIASRVSMWHPSITPDKCTQCRLCEDSCPFNAICLPETPNVARRINLERRRLAWIIGFLPYAVILFGWAGSLAADRFAMANKRVKTAELVYLVEKGELSGEFDDVKAFAQTGRPAQELYAEATQIKRRFHAFGWLLGGLLGCLIGFKVMQPSLRRTREDYETDRSRCFSCARCFETCPYEHIRRGTYIELLPEDRVSAAQSG